MTMQFISWVVDNHVATITVSRPEVMNALDARREATFIVEENIQGGTGGESFRASRTAKPARRWPAVPARSLSATATSSRRASGR
ncbi:MAG TPA: hypothetical protein PKD75_00185 [Tepidiformaceae bacterium]|nr:hypothetical protein [Tepidiformaceae bacterium]